MDYPSFVDELENILKSHDYLYSNNLKSEKDFYVSEDHKKSIKSDVFLAATGYGGLRYIVMNDGSVYEKVYDESKYIFGAEFMSIPGSEPGKFKSVGKLNSDQMNGIKEVLGTVDRESERVIDAGIVFDAAQPEIETSQRTYSNLMYKKNSGENINLSNYIIDGIDKMVSDPDYIVEPIGPKVVNDVSSSNTKRSSIAELRVSFNNFYGKLNLGENDKYYDMISELFEAKVREIIEANVIDKSIEITDEMVYFIMSGREDLNNDNSNDYIDGNVILRDYYDYEINECIEVLHQYNEEKKEERVPSFR